VLQGTCSRLRSLTSTLSNLAKFSLVEDLDEKRATGSHDHFCQDTPEPHLHDAVQEWLNSRRFSGQSKDQRIILKCKKLIKKALKVDPEQRATAMMLRNELAAICKQDRNPAESVAGSPTTSNHPFSLPASDPTPLVPSLPRSVTEHPQPETLGIAQSQRPGQPQSIPSMPRGGVATPGAAERRTSPSTFSRPQTEPPTPPDDNAAASAKMPPLDADLPAINGGLSLPVDAHALRKHRARHQVTVPGRASSRVANAMVEVPNTSSPLMIQPTSIVNLNNAKLADIPEEHLTPPDTFESKSTDSRSFQLFNQNPIFPSQAALNAPPQQSSNNALAITSDRSSTRKEDSLSRKSHKAAQFFRGINRFQAKNEKSRSQSLPTLSITTAPNLTEGSTSQAQHLSTPNQRPPYHQVLSGPPVLPSQDVAPHTRSVSSSNEDNMTIQVPAQSRHSLNPTSTDPVDNIEEQKSQSSSAPSCPQLEPLPMKHWTETHTQHHVARALSGRSSVPSVNVGDAKTHNFLNVSKDTAITLISSTAAKVAFVAPRGVDIATLNDPGCKNCIKPPENVAWERGSLAGNFLALQGCYTPPGNSPALTYVSSSGLSTPTILANGM
jgi:hypothetical protein